MNRKQLCPLLLAGTLSLLPLGLTAQLLPGSKKLSFCDSGNFDGPWFCYTGEATALADGSFAVSSYGRGQHQGRYPVTFALVEILNASGKPQGGMGGGLNWSSSFTGAPTMARYGPRGLVVAWHDVARARSDVLIEWPSGSALASESRKGLCNYPAQIASNGAGQVAVAWYESPCGSSVITSIGVRAFGPDRAAATPVLHILPGDPAARLAAPRVGIDSTGRFLVVWTERTTQPVAVVLRGQRFDSDGQLVGSPLDFGTGGSPAIYSILPDGEVAVVWRLKPPAPAGEIVWLQRHSGEGEPIGSPQVDLGLASGAAPIAIASDIRNNLVLLWQAGGTMRARLFNRDLVPQGAPFELGFASFFGMAVALSDTGRLLHVSTDTDDEWHPVGRLRRVRHEADACVRRGDLFLCDTANDGFDAESSLAFGDGALQEAPFLADWDGDGRADPCLYRNGRFFCDTGHDGGTGARSPVVGTAGDIPLLGDLNGDGRADPCVRRGAAVLCDLARNGGSKDLRITFGVAGDKVLLGDPDGDGRDDPCLWRAGRLFCDIAHDGNSAELLLDLRPLDAEGPALFGDVNGDGRDEACRFAGDRFVCGVYPPGGGAPAGTIEIVFGQAGDIPLLGDLDAF